jgi:D-alanine-D-alanine ligase
MDGTDFEADGWRIAVLSGGNSAEREISLESGSNVAAALRRAGHAVQLIDPASTELLAIDWAQFDVAFIALHGAFGEDGGIQELLDGVGLPYTGSRAAASRLAFHKSDAKERFLLAEVPTPSSTLIRADTSEPMRRKVAERLGYPLVVKPNAQGSSLGVSLVQSAEQLPAALELAFRYGPEVLLETALLGEEWTVPVLGRQILPPIRISTRRAFFDFQAKYLDDETEFAFAVATPTPTLRAIEDAASRAVKALGTSGIARVDVRLDLQGCPFVLEVNTIPGMTSHSLVPKSAARLGWNLTDLCEQAVRQALSDFTGAENRYARHRPHRTRRILRVT